MERLRPLHERRPREFRDMLALALENFGVALSLTAGPAVALPVAEEALAIFRQIQAENPATAGDAVDRLQRLCASLRASGDASL